MERPDCLRCRRAMKSGDTTKAGRAQWRCRNCRACCLKWSARGEVRARVGAGIESRPWCLKCRRVLGACGAGRFNCPTCGAFISAEAKGYRPRRDTPRPICRNCGRPKAIAGRPGTFACKHCGNLRRVLRDNPAKAAALLSHISAALPRYLTPDEREDAAQSIMLDILAAKLAPDVPAPLVLRRYAAEARGMVSDRFRFISLSQPTRDGREFGETFAA
jgi:tRNA(Ile2) C34 agmatinyltransferase TiaS